MQALPDTPGEWEVRLGHATVLEAALAQARVPRVRVHQLPVAKPASMLCHVRLLGTFQGLEMRVRPGKLGAPPRTLVPALSHPHACEE